MKTFRIGVWQTLLVRDDTDRCVRLALQRGRSKGDKQLALGGFEHG
jgi:hypothetical protein